MAKSRLRLLLLLSITAMGLFLAYILAINVSRHGKVAVTITFAPSVAVARVDGRPVQLGKNYLSPGDHTLVAKLENFYVKQQQFTVKAAQPDSVSLALQPANDAGRKLLETYPRYQQQIEAVGGLETSARVAVAETPLIGLLPISDLAGPYKIDYGQSKTRPGGSVIIIGISSPHGRANALKWIRQQGTDPTDLEIIYTDYSNPFPPIGNGAGL